MGALIALIIIGSTVWMGVDASQRDWSENKFARATWQWVVGGLGLWIVAFPAYLVARGRTPLKTAVAGAGPATTSTDWSRPEAPKAPDTRTSRSVPPPPPRPGDRRP